MFRTPSWFFQPHWRSLQKPLNISMNWIKELYATYVQQWNYFLWVYAVCCRFEYPTVRPHVFKQNNTTIILILLIKTLFVRFIIILISLWFHKALLLEDVVILPNLNMFNFGSISMKWFLDDLKECFVFRCQSIETFNICFCKKNCLFNYTCQSLLFHRNDFFMYQMCSNIFS
jgi:hypothetical protein